MAQTSWADLQARDARRLAQLHSRKDEVRVASNLGLGRTGGGYYAGMASPLSLQQAAQEGFRMSGVIYQCVMKIANPLAALKLGVRQQSTDAGVAAEYNFAHQAAVLWNRTPNPLWTAVSLKLIVWMQLELSGQSFLYADRGASGGEDPTELWPIFNPMEVVVDDRTNPLKPRLMGFRAGSLGLSSGMRGPIPLLPSEVLWLRYPDPADPWGAMAPLRAAAWAADLDNYARLWQAGEFRNQAAPPGVVYLGDVTDDQFNAIKSDFEARQTGPANARRHLFVAGPTKPAYERMGLSPLEMSYIQSREVNALDILRAFGVPKDLMDGGATYENQRNAKINLWTETLWPKLQVVEAEIDRQQLTAEPTLEAEFDVRQVDALRENIDNIATRAQKNFLAGLIQVDEGREDIGRAKLPDGAGQKLFVPRGALAPDDSMVGVSGPGSGADTPPTGGEASAAAAAVAAAPPKPPAGPFGNAAPAGRRMALVASGAWALQQLAERQHQVLADRQQRKRGTVFDETYWRQETRAALAPWMAQLYEPADVAQLDAAGAAWRSHLDVLVEQLVQQAAGQVDARMTTEQALEVATSAVDAALLEPGTGATVTS